MNQQTDLDFNMGNLNYLLLFRREDLISLFKYGEIKIYGPFEEVGSQEAFVDNKTLASKIFKDANIFEHGMEYFLLHIVSETKLKRGTTISISSVQSIYALDKTSYRIGLNLSPSVTLLPPPPPLEEAFITVQKEWALSDASKGIENVGKIFDIDVVSIGKTKKFFTRKTQKEIINDWIESASIRENPSIWYYLLRYERHQNYPNDQRGYFFDTLHIMSNWEKKMTIDDSVMRSELGGEIMEKFESSVKYEELKSFLESKPQIIKRMNKEFKRFHAIAPMYLNLRDIFQNGLRSRDTYQGYSLEVLIQRLKDENNYNQEDLGFALYLLGFALGREWTYQYVYEKSELPILAKSE